MIDSPPVLIVCADAAQGNRAVEIVLRIGLAPHLCTYITEARTQVERQIFQLALCDDELPDCNLRTAIRVLSASTGGAPVIVLSHLAEWGAYIRALSAGAFDYIACPPEPGEAERIVRSALQ